jgi:hypothetical protein
MKTDTDTETGADTITIPSADERGPREYIRTLSGDMMILQKGGIPDLRLVKGGEETHPLGEYLIEVSQKPNANKQKEESKVEELKEGEGKEERGVIDGVSERSVEPTPVERLIEASPVSPAPFPIRKEDAPPPPSPVPKPPIEAPPVSKPSSLETYSNDFIDRMRSTKASPVTVLAAEQDAGVTVGHVESELPEEAPQRGRWFIVGGVVLLVTGISGMFYAYARYAATHHLVQVAPSVGAPIFVDSRQEVAGAGAELLKDIKQASLDPIPSNTVKLLLLTTPAMTTENILSVLKTRAPGLLVRNIAPGGTVGVVSTSNGQSLFFILTAESYGATFSGMLSWEPTIFNDLGTLFPPVAEQGHGGGSATSTPVATTTASVGQAVSRTVGQKTGFKDEVMSNHDVRVYRDVSNKSAIVYGYWNQSTLIIARDSLAFAEVIARLSNASAPR